MTKNFFFSVLPCLVSLFSLSYFYRSSKKKAWIFSGATFLTGTVLLLLSPLSPLQIGLMIFANLLNFFGAVIFFLLFSKVEENNLADSLQKLRNSEGREQTEEKKRKISKAELEKLEKEIDKSLRFYGTIKGLGAALSWDDMIPHIDFALKQCLGLKDYHLYLLEDPGTSMQGREGKINFRKAISRGSRLVDASLPSSALKPQFHQRTNELYLEIPIRHGEALIGILWARLDSAQSNVHRDDFLAEALNLSEELGMGLQKARFFSSLEKLSRIDGLTGVYRRQIFNDHLNEEIRRSKTFRTVFSILIGDLDHFKKINDTYGHQVGDEVLRRAGEILKESVYETDFVARYGGEEFVILFPQADPAGVRRKAELIRQKIEQETFLFGLNKIHVTISLGIAHFPKDGTEPSLLLSIADQSLYAAKKSGRNRAIDSTEL